MFDNFGAGEIFTLAILALFFFGPEQLPRMGAKLGEWLGKLTTQSKTFMNQWRDEALAIHDAVEEVRGIRDEIVAAQRELSNTMTAARTDVDHSLDEVKSTISGSTMSLEQVAQQAKAEEQAKLAAAAQAAAAKKAAGETEAIEKTQAILSDMQTRLSQIVPEKAGTELARIDEPPAQVAATKDKADETSKLGTQEQRQPALDEAAHVPAGDAGQTAAKPMAAGGVVEATVSAVSEQPREQTQSANPFGVVKPSQPARQGPGAIEQTGQIMAELQRKLSGLPPVDEEKLPVSTAQDDWAKNYALIQETLATKSTKPSSAMYPSPMAGGVAAPISEPAIEGKQAQVVPADGTQEKIEQLNDQVSSLQTEIKSLRQALEALRAEMLIKTALSSKA